MRNLQREKPRLRLLLWAILFGVSAQAGAEQWYRSNAAGMVLEYMPSRIAALRQKYCLSIEHIEPTELPDHLLGYEQPTYRIEVHILYEQGIASRQQWVFKDAEDVTRLVSAFDFFPIEATVEEKNAETEKTTETIEENRHRPLGFIEIYNEQNLITEEHEFSPDGSETIITYFYKHDVLVKAESRRKFFPKASSSKTPSAEPSPQSATLSAETPAELTQQSAMLSADPAAPQSAALPADPAAPQSATPPTESPTEPETAQLESVDQQSETPLAEASTEPILTVSDTYRYSRSHALRSIERRYEAAETDENTSNRLVRVTFPYLGPNSWNRTQFITPVTPHRSGFMEDVFMDSGGQTAYTTDARGKLLTETRQDADGEVQGELRNTWAGDRLESIEWKAGDDERRTEYEYDAAGDRIIERNYTKGVLERTVRREDEQEIEELYMNGEVILRAVWENGRKVSEERIRSSTRR